MRKGYIPKKRHSWIETKKQLNCRHKVLTRMGDEYYCCILCGEKIKVV